MSERSSLTGTDESERGTAFIEFAISLPFLVTLIIGVIDIGRGMREYFVLKAAVIEGADRAMSLANLQGSATCSGTVDSSHKQVHRRVEGLLELQSTGGIRDACVSSEVSTAPDTTANTVMVRASANFVALFPLFDGVPIAAEARMPYLRAP